MMRTGWSSGKKKVGIGRLIDWIGLACENYVIAGIPSKIPSLLEFRHCEALKKPKQSRSKLNKS